MLASFVLVMSCSLPHQALTYHGSRLHVMGKEYKSLLKRIQRRTGVKQPVAEVKLHELKDYMEKKLSKCLVFSVSQ